MGRLSSLVRTDLDSSAFDGEFKQMLEDHLASFISRSSSVIEIDNSERVRCRGDFYALLTEKAVNRRLFYLTLRINGYADPVEYKGELSEIVIPDQALFESLLQKYKIRKGII